MKNTASVELTWVAKIRLRRIIILLARSSIFLSYNERIEIFSLSSYARISYRGRRAYADYVNFAYASEFPIYYLKKYC